MIVGCIVLAAGRSSRMGGPNKLLAELGGKPLLAHVLDAVVQSGLPALVVTGHDRAAIEALSPFPTVDAADYAEGMSRSLRAGIAVVPDEWQAAILCLGDMPNIDAATLCLLASHAARAAIIVPTFEGQRGNPVLWGRDHFAELMAVNGDAGGRGLLKARVATALPVELSAILQDVDTPDDLEALRNQHCHR